MNNFVTLEYLDDYDEKALADAVEKSFANLGIKNFFKPKMKVILKVCMPKDVSADFAESTNPAVVKAIADYLDKLDITCIVVDCPKNKHSNTYLNEVYLSTGMLNMANTTKCQLNQNLAISTIEYPYGKKTKGITVLDVVNQADAIINIGKLKIKNTFGYVGACSNIFSFMPGEVQNLILNRQRTLGDYNDYLIDMLEIFKSKLVLNVIDSVVALEAGNTPRMLNCLAMSQNPYSIDACILDILGIKYDNTLLRQAKNRELFDYNKPYKVIGEKIEKFKLDDFAKIDFDENNIIPFSKSYFRTHQQRVVIDKNKCKGCRICSKICPTGAITMKYDKNNELYAEIDYKKCIYCNKCIAACPYSVIKHETPSKYNSMIKKINKYNQEE